MSPWLFIAFAGFMGAFHGDIHGGADLNSIFYHRKVFPTNQILETGRLSLGTTLKPGADFRVKFSPIFQADPFNNSTSERVWSDLPEGYIQYRSSGWVIQAGYNTFTWGVTDGYNPLDVLNARRYQDPLKQEKLGALSLSIKKDVENLSFEAVYIPLQRTSILPGEKSRWLPRQILTTTSIGDGSQSAMLNLPPELDYHFNSRQDRDGALENNLGLRIQINGLVQGLDASLVAFNGGSASSPAIDVTASGTLVQLLPILIIQADPVVTLTPVYYRKWIYGGSLVYAIEGVIFRAETAITRLISKGPDLLGNAEEFILGIEKPVSIAAHDLTLILQGTYANHSAPISNGVTSLNRIFDRAIIVGARLSLSEKLTLLTSGLLDTQFHEELAHLEWNYNLTDNWKLGISGDAIWGGSDTPFGAFSSNDRMMVSIKTVF